MVIDAVVPHEELWSICRELVYNPLGSETSIVLLSFGRRTMGGERKNLRGNRLENFQYRCQQQNNSPVDTWNELTPWPTADGSASRSAET